MVALPQLRLGASISNSHIPEFTHSERFAITCKQVYVLNYTMATLISVLYFRIKYPRVILRKGHIGLAFYFIFSGAVFINIEGLHVETSEVVYKTVSILQRGDAFGVSCCVNWPLCFSCFLAFSFST